MLVTTLPERKRLEAERRIRAASLVAEDLRAYARDRKGRFILFGSFAAGRMRYDSDLDVLIDFDAAESAEAWRFVEDLCSKAEIEADIHDARTSRDAFVRRAVTGGLILT